MSLPPTTIGSYITPATTYSGAGGTSGAWIGGTTYVSADELFSYLKIKDDATQEDYNFAETIVLPTVCDYIDRIAGTTWGLKTVRNAYYSIGKPAYLGWYLTGSPVYLGYYPIVPYNQQMSFEHLGIWNGQNYQEWAGTMPEGRWGTYWVDTNAGILWLIGWYWYMGYEVQITFNYGYNTAGTNKMDGQVKLLALHKSALTFLENERYTAKFSQGIGGVDMQHYFDWLQAQVMLEEGAIQGLQPITGSWLP